MHKKLAADLTSLAHSILQMKNKEDVFALKTKAHEVYEKLALLAYVEEYIKNTPNTTTTKEALISKIAAVETVVENNNPSEIKEVAEENILFEKEEAQDAAIIKETLFSEPEKIVTEEIKPDVIEQPFDELEGILFGEETKNETTTIEEIETPTITEKVQETILEEKELPIIEETVAKTPIETKETIIEKEINVATPVEEIQVQNTVIDDTSSITVTTPEVIPEEIVPVIKDKIPTLEEELGDTISVDVMANLFEKAPPKTLNDRLFQDTIKIDLNDRIAFVKNLFDGNQEDFNRVISQLNTIKTEKSAKQFIIKMIKPDYDWSDKEEYETRLLEIIERRFI